ncbi:putative CWF21 domain-containing protein [Seiridium cardinale]|uniref:CWF21 domain-containing protein n=1 Tax=Seiridium cardinale TaxID=138064 RepID=A0ABR2XYB8_9PEZI
MAVSLSWLCVGLVLPPEAAFLTHPAGTTGAMDCHRDLAIVLHVFTLDEMMALPLAIGQHMMMARSLDMALASLIDHSTIVLPLDAPELRRETVEAHCLVIVFEALRVSRVTGPVALRVSLENDLVVLPESQGSDFVVLLGNPGTDLEAHQEGPELAVRFHENEPAARDRGREDDRGLAAADTWRRPQRSRSPVRRPSPRRSPIRRSSPPPRRFSPPRRDARDDRDRRNFASGDPRSLPQSHSFQTEVHATFRGQDRANPNNIPVSQSKRISQSPLTHGPLSSDYTHDYEGHSRRFDTPRAAYSVPGQRQGHNASRAPNLTSSQAFYAVENSRHRNPQSESSFHVHTSNVDIPYRGRSRSADRDRRDVRDRRSPPSRRVSPPGGRGGPFRRRSPSMDRRDDRYGSAQRRPSPPRESAVSSAYPSRDQSRRPSPLPINTRRDDRSNPQSPISSRNHSRSPQRASLRERSPARPSMATTSTRSPPRGPAAFRPPPTGPRGDRAWRDTRDDRDTRNFSGRSVSAVSETPNRPTPPPNRQDATSPGAPPSGPRGYGAPRGGYGRGGRGNTWVAPGQGRNLSPGPNPASATTGTNNGPVPTGPRGHTPSSTSVPSTPTAQSKPFNPPKGPAAEKRQLSVFEKEVATMTPILAGGKMNIEDEAAMKGVLPEQLAHFKTAEDEADRIRKEMERNEEKTRAMMADFRRGQREGELYKLKTDLTEAAVAKSSGEGFTGSAF